MRLIKGLIVFLVLLVAVLIGVAFVLPASAHVERSITIARPAAQVFAVVNSYRRFNEWSPWAAKDPSAHYTVSGPVAGVGAKHSVRRVTVRRAHQHVEVGAGPEHPRGFGR